MAKSRKKDDFTGVDIAVESACTLKNLRREDSGLIPPQNHSYALVLKSRYF